MLTFSISLLTAKTEEDVLAVFVRSVEPETAPPPEKGGIEGSAHWGEMRWREREFHPADGVSYGPTISATAKREGDYMFIRGRVHPATTYWLARTVGLVGLAAAFGMSSTQGMPFGLPDELSWLFVAAAIWFCVRSVTVLRDHGRRAATFITAFLQETPNQSPQPTPVNRRG